MGILTEDMKRVVREQRLGFIATVCPDGTPNLSPKGTVKVWDDNHLVFADIASPGTLANLRHNSSIEINMVDPFLRKGYRFKGEASIVGPGPQFDSFMAWYTDPNRGSQSSVARLIRAFVLVRVVRALPLISPGYTGGVTEAEMRQQWETYYASLKPTPEAEALEEC
jgi:uncharacterized protein